MTICSLWAGVTNSNKEKVKQVLKLPGNLNHVIVEGEKRAKLIQYLESNECD